MLATDPKQYLWVEKYRPKKLEDTILPKAIKEMATGYVESGRLPNLILSGVAGCGKTTLAKAMCDSVGADWIMINAANESGIDTFRNTVMNFSTTVSFSDARKVIILDEFENANQNFQNALKAGIEAVSENCTFVLTCNHLNRIIEPLQSRCGLIDFTIPKEEVSDLSLQIFRRIIKILDAEGVEYEKAVIAKLVQNNFPDFRKCLTELQKYSSSGKIDSGILINVTDELFNSLIQILKAKKFTQMRQWVVDNSHLDTASIFRMFFDKANNSMESKSIPGLVLLIDEYQDKLTRSIDQEITLAAFLTSIIVGDYTWK